MKNNKLNFVFLLLSFIALSGFAQTTNVFDAQSELSWLGLDFTKAKFVGDLEAFQKSNIPNLMQSWNSLMIDEAKKYNIPLAFHRLSVDSNIDVTLDHNSKLDGDKMWVASFKSADRLDEGSIQDIVSKYNFKGLKGNGLMFNVESFDKPQETATIWVTVVDMDKKKVLFTRRLTAKPSGFGLRNYWAGAVYRMLKDIEKTYYTQWSGNPSK